MKSIKYILPLLILILAYCCKKDKETTISPPKVETASVDNIMNTSARVGGRITDDGNASITERGYYWDTITSPEKTGTKVNVGAGDGAFYDTLQGLTVGTTYYVKAFAKNASDISFGNETYFTTQISLPTISATTVTSLTKTSVLVGGEITDNGGAPVTKRGVYWGKSAQPQTSGIKLEIDSGLGTVADTIADLDKAITYYVVAFATNVKGTAYGNEVSFTTEPSAATVSTKPALNIGTNTALLKGEVLANGGAPVTEHGFYWDSLPNVSSNRRQVVVGSGIGNFESEITNLSPNTNYYFISYAINSVDTVYGQEFSFTTKGETPEIRIIEIADIDINSAIVKAVVNANDLSTVVNLEYGTTQSFGNAIAYGSVINGNNDTVEIEISGLQSNTIYYVRYSASNELGLVYSITDEFRTVVTGISGTVNDEDGNTYNTIGIGHQFWMTENLRTTKLNNGADILQVSNDSIWNVSNSARYCWYNNDSATYAQNYGALYSWQVVNQGNLCPNGWHVPTDEDFTELVNFVGGASEAGLRLKDQGTSRWNSNNNATDNYQFSAVGAGKRSEEGIFDFIKVEGNLWTSTEYSTLTSVYLQFLFNNNAALQAYGNKNIGMSVRCVQD